MGWPLVSDILCPFRKPFPSFSLAPISPAFPSALSERPLWKSTFGTFIVIWYNCTSLLLEAVLKLSRVIAIRKGEGQLPFQKLRRLVCHFSNFPSKFVAFVGLDVFVSDIT